MSNTRYTMPESAEKALRYIGETDGNAMELNCRRAVAEYALYGTMPEDREVSSRIAAIRFEIDRLAEEEKKQAEEAAKKKGRRRKYDYADIAQKYDNGMTCREIQEETGAYPVTISRALALRPKACFNGYTGRRYRTARRWR